MAAIIDPFKPAQPDGGIVDPFKARPVSPADPLPAAQPRLKRTWGEAFKDTGLGVAQGAVNLVGGVASLVESSLPINQIRSQGARLGLLERGGTTYAADLTASANDAIGRRLSPVLQRKKQELAETEGFVGSAKKVVTDPALLGQFVAEQVPTLATLGAGTAVTGARAATAAAGRAGAARQAVLTRGGTAAQADAAAAKVATDASQAAGQRFLTRASGTLGGTSANLQAREQALALPDEVWDENPAFQALLGRGMAREDAKKLIAGDAGLAAIPLAAAAGVVGARVSAPFETSVFTRNLPGGVRGLATPRGAAQLARGAGVEALEETVQEGGEQFSSNLGVRTVDPNQSLTEGVAEAAGIGAAVGGVMGGGMAAGGMAASRPGQAPRLRRGEPAPAQDAAPPPDGPIAPPAPPAAAEQASEPVQPEASTPAPTLARPARFPEAPAGSLQAAVNAIDEATPAATPAQAQASPPAAAPVATGGTTEIDRAPAPAPPWVNAETGEFRQPAEGEIMGELRKRIDLQSQAGTGIRMNLRELAQQWGVDERRLRILNSTVMQQRKLTARAEERIRQLTGQAAAAEADADMAAEAAERDAAPTPAGSAAAAAPATNPETPTDAAARLDEGNVPLGSLEGAGEALPAGSDDADARGDVGEPSAPGIAEQPALELSQVAPAAAEGAGPAAAGFGARAEQVLSTFDSQPAAALELLSDEEIRAVATAAGRRFAPTAKPANMRKNLAKVEQAKLRGALQGVLNAEAPAAPGAQESAALNRLSASGDRVALIDYLEAFAARKRIESPNVMFEQEFASGDSDRGVARYVDAFFEELPEPVRRALQAEDVRDQETGEVLNALLDSVRGGHIGQLRRLRDEVQGAESAGPAGAAQPAPSADRRANESERARIDALPADERDAEIARLRGRVAELERETRTNPVTGLPNKAAFEADEALGWPAVVAIDMDGLKRLNDTIGHENADAVLRTLGRELEALGSDSARFYHRSGDEFAARFKTRAEAEQVMESLQADLEGVRALLVVEVAGQPAQEYEYRGIGISYGLGANYEQADLAANEQKRERAAAGVREEPRADGAPRRLREVPRDPEGRQGDAQPEPTPPAVEAAPEAQPTVETPAPAGVSASGDPAVAIQAAAADAATSPENDRPAPTDAQKEAGNYKKGHLRLHGLDMAIENPAGTRRRPEWPPLAHHYGYIKRTEGADGDHVDVFLGDNAGDASLPVFVVNQVNRDGKFDEHKVVMGFADEAAAREAYLANYSKGWTGLGSIRGMTVDEFKAWLREGDTTKQAPPATPKVRVRGGKPEYVLGEDTLRAYFQPGRVVPAYIGNDRVLGFTWANGQWSVRVIGVNPDGSPKAGERERQHRTSPSAKELRAALGDPAQYVKAKGTTVRQARETPAPAPAPAPTPAADAGNTEDSGAELWYNRRNRTGAGVRWEDIAELNPTLKVKEAVKSKAWPRPDYEALVADGMHPVLARLLKQVYDGLAAKPDVQGVATDDTLREYLEDLAKVRDVVFAALRKVDAARLSPALAEGMGPKLTEIIQAAGLHSIVGEVFPGEVSSRFSRSPDNRRRALALGGNRMLKAAQIGIYDVRKAAREVAEGWPRPKESWERMFTVREAPVGTKLYSRGESRTTTEPEFYITRNGTRRIEADGLATRDEAVAKARELAAKGRKRGEVMAEESLALQDAERIGAARRAADENVTSDRVRETFGFKGVNFGNWMKGNGAGLVRERQLHLNHAYDAFLDLAELLNVPARALSLNGMLGLAFGAQGSGLGSGAAHFVPGVNEINLTRAAGVGSLAHEWGHSLDHYFAVQAGDRFAKQEMPFITHAIADGLTSEISLRPEVLESFRAVYQAMTRRPLTAEEVADRTEKRRADELRRLNTWLKPLRAELERRAKPAEKDRALAEFDALSDRIRAGDLGEGYVPAQNARGGLRPVLADMRNLIKDATGRVPSKQDFDGMAVNAEAHAYSVANREDAKSHVPQVAASNYAIEAAKLDKDPRAFGGGNYWKLPTEMLARAFQSYVLDRLADRQARNDYLTRPQMDEATFKVAQEMGLAPAGDRYPRGAEREAINAAFDTLAATLQTREEGGNIVLFSQPGAAPEGASRPEQVQAVEGWTAPVLGRWGSNAPRVQVVADAEGLPARAKADPGYKTADGFYDDGTKTVYLVADKLPTERDALRVLAHESVGHYGIEAITGPVLWEQISNTVARMRESGKHTALFAEVDRRYRGANAAIALRETLAVMAEKGVRNSVTERVIAAIRAFVRNVLGIELRFTEGEMRQHLVAAARYMRAGARPRDAVAAGVTSTPAFSKGTRSAFNDAAKFAGTVRDFLDGKLPKDRAIQVTEGTPDVLVKLGAPDVPIVMAPGTLTKFKFAGGDKHPEITRGMMTTLVRHLHEPVAVFDSATEPGALVVMTEVDADGKRVMASLHVRATAERMVVNRVTSLYGRERREDFARWAREGKLRYLDRTRVPAWLTTDGLQLPGVGPAAAGTARRVLVETDVIKPFTSGTGAYSQPARSGIAARVDAQALKDIRAKATAALGMDPDAALTRIAGVALRNAGRAEGTLQGDPEPDPFTPEAMALLEQWEGMRFPSSKYLFHTTPAANLDSIRREGLRPGKPARYEGTSSSSVVSLAANEATAAYYGAPGDVMLRVKKDYDPGPLDTDLLAGDGAYTTERGIPPEALEVKEGRKWVPLVPAAAPRALFSQPPDQAIADLEAVMAADKDKGAVERARARLADMTPAKIKDALRGTWLGALATNHLTELGSDYFDGMRHYTGFLKTMEADRNTLMAEGEEIAERVRKWATKNRSMAERLFGLMHEATIDGVDPSKAYQPLQFRFGGALHEATRKNVADAIKAIRQQMRERSGDSKQDMLNRIKALTAMMHAEKRRQGQYGGLVARWNELSPEAQQAFKDMRDAYVRRSEAVEEALVQRIQDLKADGAQDNHVRVLTTKIREQFETNRLQGVYFPLQRFGQYFVSGEKDDTTTFLMFESLNDAARAEKDLKARGWKITSRGKRIEAKADQAPSGTFVAEVISELRKANISEKTQDSIYQLYLNALPELSMRKHQIHRKAVPGFDPDAMRAFGWHMQHGSHQLAKLRYMHKLEGVLKLLDQQQKAARKEEGADVRRIAAGDAILEELNRRHQWIANPVDSKLTNLVSSFGFTYYLGATPAAALVNLSQTAIVTYPVLAAKFGPAKAMNALLAGMRDSMRTVGNLDRTLADPEEQRAYAALKASGAIDKTQAHNLAGIAEGGLQGYNPAWAKTMEVIGWAFHKAEVVNREASAIAAFRLAKQAGMEFDAAVRYAHEAVIESHFDYANANRARFMQSGTAKVLLMFRQYSLNMTWFLARNVWQATKGQDPQVRREARRKLAGILGMTSLFSGIMGLPLVSVTFGVLNAVAASFGDDDEPWDAETEFRNFLADMFGADVAQVLATGPANALTGADIASRVSLSQLWFRDADRELEGRGLYFHLLEQAAGPMGGVLKNMLVGKQQIDEGHLWRGVETMLPKGLKDVLKAGRYSTQGVNNLRGDPMVEDLSLWQALLQLNGFTPAQVAQQYDANGALKGYEQFILNRRQHLVDAYALAWRLGDAAGQRDATAKMAAFNRANPELAINAETLRRSMRTRLRYSQRAEDGIVLNPKLEARLRGAVRFNRSGEGEGG